MILVLGKVVIKPQTCVSALVNELNGSNNLQMLGIGEYF